MTQAEPMAASGTLSLQGARQVALFIAIFLIAIAPVLTAPVLPMIDYYNHLARYYVLAHVGHDPFIAQAYEARWGILPNIGLDILGVALIGWLPPMIVAKLIALIIFATQYTGVLFLNRQLTGRWSPLVAVLSAVLLYSFIFTWGFSNFLLGLGLALWTASWWLWRRDNLILAVPVGIVMAVLVFLTHGVAFALYGLLAGGLEIGLFLAARVRSLTSLALRMGGLALQAVIPAFLFLASPTPDVPEGITNADEAVTHLAAIGRLTDRLVELAVYRLTTIVRMSETSSLALDIGSFVTIAIVLLVLAFRRRVALAAVALPAILIGLVLMVIVPPAMFSVGYVADRIPLFVAFTSLAALCVRGGWTMFDRGCAGVLIGLVVLRLAFLAVDWQGYERDVASLRQVMRAIPERSLIGYVNAANGARTDGHRRCEMFGPLLTPLGGHMTEVFAEGSKQPIAVVGRMKRAGEEAAVPPGPDPLQRTRARFEAIARSARFDYVLACEADRLGPPPPGATLIARDGRLSLFRL